MTCIQEMQRNEINRWYRTDNDDEPGSFTPNKMKLALDASMAEAEIGKLKKEITALKQALENAEKNSIIPKVNNKKIEQLLTTSAETMRTSTVQNALKGLWAKNQQLEAEQIDGEKDQRLQLVGRNRVSRLLPIYRVSRELIPTSTHTSVEATEQLLARTNSKQVKRPHRFRTRRQIMELSPIS